MSDYQQVARLDLNLLIALDALLTEKSVTHAARRLHLSQPALSASLARLRRHFGDDILARQGNTYRLTPLGERLTEHTTTALESAHRVFDLTPHWRPEQSTREFTIFGSDYGLAMMGALLSKRMAETAPRATVRMRLHNPTVVEDAAHHLRTADGMILPHGFLTELSHADLWQDEWVILAAEDNPHLSEPLTMDMLAACPWVVTYLTRSAFTAADRQMRHLGLEPRIEAVVESFLALPNFVRRTRRLAVLHRGIAQRLPLQGLRLHSVPFDVPTVRTALWWHPVHDNDREHRWFRELLCEVAAEIRIPAGSAR
ncbi:LysR family transcriptional regulator [Nesterenkonia sp. CL21]|uniref:LysR family transcriptional regulator n=1 Tax=Nesterenkonia sp. CL21 TaxID=3064894 RepID=UPI002879FC2E|nr:LysR family transcriptional regulator [Nesterenkonia sp. CL21]MDS2173444.1 LysR family transcriptional regulator [Nesterenkonia sp. CL21]